LYDTTDQANGALKLSLEVLLQTPNMRRDGVPPHRLSRGSALDLYWTPAQMVTHQTSNGCNLNPGDLLGTGTISSPGPEGSGSLLELTRGGRTPIELPGGETRRFLEDGDEITLRASAHKEGFVSIGFGECRGRISATV
jgi:fumarylacetoacetase